MTRERGDGRIHREVQANLPGLVDGTLPRWRRRLVNMHLKRCDVCTSELVAQQAVVAGLDDLEVATAAAVDDPPAGLLDALLEQADKPGVRGRAAVPVRGAVSGARPALSVALLLVAAAAGTAAGYATWKATRAMLGLVRNDD
jgi:anti-sigma factor RsiW